MKANNKLAKVAFIGLFIISILIANIFFVSTSLEYRFFPLVVCLYGFHFVYAYVYELDMYVTGAVVTKDGNPTIRFFILLGGLVALFFGFNGFFIPIGFW